jgi:hypothetical protein
LGPVATAGVVAEKDTPLGPSRNGTRSCCRWRDMALTMPAFIIELANGFDELKRL